MESSRGKHVYCAHTMSATIMPGHDGTCLQITFTKYDQYCPPIQGLGAQNTLFSHFFFWKVEQKGILHRKSIPACTITYGSPFPNMKVTHEYLPLLHPILWRLGAKMYLIRILTFKVAQGQIQ